jgi:NitT/TauT family transport system substrate-binding protein
MFEKLEEWGATVDPIVITTTSGIQTMVAGESDAGAHGADEMILGSAEGAEAVAIGAPNSRLAYVLIGDEDVQSVEDLQGATIAMSGPSGFDALLSRLTLEDIGLNPDSDAQFLQIGGSGERAAALAAGSADAATVFLEDWFEIRQRAENLTLVDYMAQRFPEFPAEAYFLNREYMEANPEMATAIACANLEYNSWIAEDPEGYVQWGLSIQDNATEQGLQDTYEAAQEVNIFPTDPDEVLSPEGMQALMEAMVETGDISQPVDVDQVYDDSYLTQAAEMGCGA